MAESAAWFVDGAYLDKVWQKNLHRVDRLDYLLLRRHLERKFSARVGDSYYFNGALDPLTAQTNPFHRALAFPPPTGPGLRVKLYRTHKRPMHWPKQWGGGPMVHPDTGQQFEHVQQKGVDVGLAFHMMRSYGQCRSGARAKIPFALPATRLNALP